MRLAAILRTLEQRIGLEPTSLGDRVLGAAVDRRARALGISDLAVYAARIQADRDEFQELVEELVVPETWFFRDVRPFEVLAEHAGAAPMTAPAPAFRILSVPCATGEEPYSAAMVGIEAVPPPRRVEVHALDISARALARARAGAYDERALRAVSPARRERFFLRESTRWEVAEVVRACVVFRQSNLAEDDDLPTTGTYDAIFCRNLLIYLNDRARARIMGRLDERLAPGGLLFLGHAESLATTPFAQAYEPIGGSGAHAFRRRAGASADQVAHVALGGLARPRELNQGRLPKPARETKRLPAPTRRAIASAQPLAPATLAEIRAMANRREHGEAIAACEAMLAREGPKAEVFHLLGMLQQAAGKLDEAESSLSRAVYLDPADADSLLALALLARRKGDAGAAARYDRQARRAREREVKP